MKTDPIPVWKFFEIPENGVEICVEISREFPENSRESDYWQRAREFLGKVKNQTTDQLNTRDFDWMLKLRVLFEKDEIVLRILSNLNK